MCVFLGLQVLVPGATTETMLQQLLPDMPYNVAVVPLYEDGEGPAASDLGTTRKHPPAGSPEETPAVT